VTRAHIGRRFGEPKKRNTRLRFFGTAFRTALLLLVMSPVAVVGYQALIWLRTGNWTWVQAIGLLPTDLVSTLENPSSWVGLSELVLFLANLPLAGVMSVFAVAIYVFTDVLGR